MPAFTGVLHVQVNTVCFAIVRVPGGWQLVAPQGRWGLYKYKVDAEEAALRLAERLWVQGVDVEILVQDTFGRLDPLAAA
jgi:hypothetical protein